MGLQEYIVTSTGAAQENPFQDFLDALGQWPDVTVKKVGSRFLVIEASEQTARGLSDQCAPQYVLSPNRNLELFG